jgi:hypothetical protein
MCGPCVADNEASALGSLSSSALAKHPRRQGHTVLYSSSQADEAEPQS